MKKTYIFGHKKPDTDSVVSAIALSNLKNTLGDQTTPRILGELNEETSYILARFHTPEPKILNDVKLQIKDIDYQKKYFLQEKNSIFKSYYYMTDNRVTTLPIINQANKLVGILSMKDIAKDQISGDVFRLYTSYDNVLEALEGESILRFDEELDGTILVASYRSTTFIETVKLKEDHILIVGDRHSIIEYAVNAKTKLIIITGNGLIKPEHVEIAKKNKVNIIRTPYDSFKVSKTINLCNYISTIVNRSNIICFNENNNVTECLDVASKVKYSNYPIVNNKMECLGMLRLADINLQNHKKVVLVDHNHYEQSADGLEEAEIVEVIDHHNIGNLGTSKPINFRTMPVGSTSTIVFSLYKEKNIDLTEDMAGLLLSGILSDTLILQSPTTTQVDVDAVNELAKRLNIDYYAYGMEMIKAGCSLQGKTKEQIISADFKIYKVGDKAMRISQVLTLDIELIQQEKDGYIALLDEIAEHNDIEVVALFVTDIIEKGSYVYYNHKAEEIMAEAFRQIAFPQGKYLPDCVSRKKQIVPFLSEVLEKK